jgi:glycosyltransferase involved in cell wall biosynthesis
MRVLHVLSQRPALTGSGTTLDALVDRAGLAGWRQRAVVGVPAAAGAPLVGSLEQERIHPLRFGGPALPFDVPGMSDVMPYPSTVFSTMTGAQLDRYRRAWSAHLVALLDRFSPDVIHAHHVWMLSAMLKELAPATPLVIHSHNTGLRQMRLCPHLAGEVRQGCARSDRFAVLHEGLADDLAAALGVPRTRIAVVGAGYREDLFHPRGRAPDTRGQLLYVGKYSAAKGLPWLLDALERLVARGEALTLHVAGGGAGEEADALRARMEAMEGCVVLHGQLPQPDLAALMRRCQLCVLPSMYEGVPLVLAEALACGCRLVSTALPGVVGPLAPTMGPALELVSMPGLVGIDVPDSADLPAFVDRLEHAVAASLDRPPVLDELAEDGLARALEPFTWGAVFTRVEALWRGLLG